ncbi:hypothetical protein CSIM01_01608 [Colletotrichum simmondsii]|uniref:Zn(2)-C6 fungal-type domain-containing protein n=1 Tax=Colletotrichum simmondsii TaxID=703756 RepID=A0A135TRG6_9PEZI|nr:hypothetical protein CSIM01_01608 [Colletotrichum simmondsii]
MRQTLRRSCAACAKSKHSCDLRTPRCSRCVKRKVLCAYANEPLTAAPAATGSAPGGSATSSPGPPLDGSGALTSYRFGSLDPFDSYPQTRLPREQVQRLIHSFLHKIAFEYYPLDLNATSNPFLVSWWPLALGDPALFHVSLQTACLDEELLAQKGFQSSEILMADSVALLRRKVQDDSMAIQDGTMNSVITLAAIENDVGIGDGVPTPPEWQIDPTVLDSNLSHLGDVEIENEVENVLRRLRSIFRRAQQVPLQPTRLHDLSCFVIHRLLLSSPEAAGPHSASSESVRLATILYIFIIQGPTYYSHAVIFNTIVNRLMESLEDLVPYAHSCNSLFVWLLTVGMVASQGTQHYTWLTGLARDVVALTQVKSWVSVLACLRSVLWLDVVHGEDIFRPHWETIFGCLN